MVHRYNKDAPTKNFKEATDLFMSKGYLGTSTREIAQKLSHPAAQYFITIFSDKEKLYTAVLTLRRC